MNYAVILSGGVGNRFGADIPKQYLDACGKPIIRYTLERFFSASCIDKIVVVASAMWHEFIGEIISALPQKPFDFADAGASRQGSIFNGLKKCVESGIEDGDRVIIHDAVRPLVSGALINKCMDALDENDAVMPVLHVNDTVYVSDDGTHVSGLLDRDKLYAGQAPEAFNLKKYYELNNALTADALDSIRGSSELAFKNGLAIKLIDGDLRNFKITTVADLERFKQILEQGNYESI